MRRRGGYMLVEMLAIIILLGAMSVVVTRMTTLVLRVYRDAPAADAALRAQRQWLTILRGDAWAAPRVSVDDGGVTLGEARWTSAEGTLSRVAGDDIRRWPKSRPLTWRWDGRSLVVASGDEAVPLLTPSVSTKEPS